MCYLVGWTETGIKIFASMSVESSIEENIENGDMIWSLVKDLEFLKYKHSIEQMKPSRFTFPADTEYSEVYEFSAFGMDTINDFLHIGIISKDSVVGSLPRNPILLLVWPKFVSPTAYGDYKVFLPGMKKIKTMIFQVPGSLFLKYSNGHVSLHDVFAATAVTAPVGEWKLLERMVISSFYHLIFDKPTTNSHGSMNVWQNYPKDKLEKQLLFLCCGPQGLAYLIKRMLKRNWARIARKAISVDTTCKEKCTAFCTGGALQLLIEWATFSFKKDALVRFLEAINSSKPALDSDEIIEKAQFSFVQHISVSKRHRCDLCSFETDSKSHFNAHGRTHTGERPFVCDVCSLTFKQLTHLKHHKIKRHTGEYSLHCRYCGRQFLTPSDQKYHLSIHEKKGTLHFQCHKCSNIFKDETMLKKHMPSLSNDPVFQCNVCYKKLDSETALLAHSRLHDKEKPFNCHICGRGFLTKWNLTQHYKVHSESRPVFSCRFCDKQLSNDQSRRRHEAGQHEDQFKV